MYAHTMNKYIYIYVYTCNQNKYMYTKKISAELILEDLICVYDLFVWNLDHVLCATLRESECFEAHDFHNLCKTLC